MDHRCLELRGRMVDGPDRHFKEPEVPRSRRPSPPVPAAAPRSSRLPAWRTTPRDGPWPRTRAPSSGHCCATISV